MILSVHQGLDIWMIAFIEFDVKSKHINERTYE